MLKIHVKLLHPLRSTTKLLKSTSTSINCLRSPMLRPFSELSAQDEPVLRYGRLFINSRKRPYDYNVVPENMIDACRLIGRIKDVCIVEENVHTMLSLKLKIEVLEELIIQPENISVEVWKNMPRREKWEHFFRHPEDYEFYEGFIKLVMAFNDNDPKTSAMLVEEMYSAFCAALIRYACCRSVDSFIFQDERFKKLIEYFDYAPIHYGDE